MFDTSADDSVSEPLPIGFGFNFFGNTYTSFRVSSNGFITFSDYGDSGCCSGQSLPNRSTPNNLIALGWSDLRVEAGQVRYQTVGSPGSRSLVVTFTDVTP